MQISLCMLFNVSLFQHTKTGPRFLLSKVCYHIENIASARYAINIISTVSRCFCNCLWLCSVIFNEKNLTNQGSGPRLMQFSHIQDSPNSPGPSCSNTFDHFSLQFVYLSATKSCLRSNALVRVSQNR